jgi:CRISPR/Cas system-associated endoribonuclease Cas2
MPTAAINQHGCRVSLKGERLEVFGRNDATQRDEVLREIPLRDLDRLIVAETVQITSQALAALLRASIPVSLLGCSGQFLGGFLPAQNDHGLARLRQYQHTLDPQFGLQMAGRIVTAKLYNQRRVLQRLIASHSDVGQASPPAGPGGVPAAEIGNPDPAPHSALRPPHSALDWLDALFAPISRSQTSVFECRLDEAEFTEFWLQLLGKIDEEEDRIVAYKIDAHCAKETMTAGRMVCSEKSLCYLV